jgi:hypothetical protein
VSLRSLICPEKLLLHFGLGELRKELLSVGQLLQGHGVLLDRYLSVLRSLTWFCVAITGWRTFSPAQT